MSYMKEICANCGKAYEDHYGKTCPWPHNYCPGIEGRANWDILPETVFKGSGLYRECTDYAATGSTGGYKP